jgi:hypothetical protein
LRRHIKAANFRTLPAMTPEQFKKAWALAGEDNLNPLQHDKLLALGLSATTATFLSQSGLPESAAPFLSFCDNSDDVLYGIGKLRDLHDFLPEEFDDYVVIGSCNEGDPIVINIKTDQVEFMDHEDNFSSQLFNSSIATLAGSLIAYRDFVVGVEEAHGEDAYINAAYTEEQLLGLKAGLTNADPEAMAKQGFWYEEFESEQMIWTENKGK